MENFLSNILALPFEMLILLGVSYFLILVLFIIVIANIKKTNRIQAKYNRFMNGLSDRNIEELLDTCLSNLNSVNNKNKEIEVHINDVERKLFQCIQKIGVVRFNAFDNVGSDLSFSIALLDTNDSGVVISGIYSRETSSTYAKPITAGKSKYTLSAEEIQAIDIAKKVNIERGYKE